MYYVYILWSENTKKYYCGYTSNLLDRLKRHNAGYERSTKYGVPWQLVWKTEKATSTEAIKLERMLKNLCQNRLKKFVNKYSDGVAGH